MANTITERKACTINDLADLVGRIESLTLDGAEWSILRKQIDKAMDANKKTAHARNDRIALIRQVAANPAQWGIA